MRREHSCRGATRGAERARWRAPLKFFRAWRSSGTLAPWGERYIWQGTAAVSLEFLLFSSRRYSNGITYIVFSRFSFAQFRATIFHRSTMRYRSVSSSQRGSPSSSLPPPTSIPNSLPPSRQGLSVRQLSATRAFYPKHRRFPPLLRFLESRQVSVINFSSTGPFSLRR